MSKLVQKGGTAQSRGGKKTKRFYYRSKRVGSQVRKVYLGSGGVAAEAATKDAAAKAKRAAEKRELADYQAALNSVLQLAEELKRGVNQLMEATLLSMGFHQHRGQWRHCRAETGQDDRASQLHKEVIVGRKSNEQLAAEREQSRLEQERQKAEVARQKAEAGRQRAEEERRKEAAKLAAMTPLDRAIYRARQGEPEGMTELEKELDANPAAWQHHGNLTARTLEGWSLLIANKDPYQSETLRRHLDTMRSELAGPTPSPLERLLVDRIRVVIPNNTITASR